ncbi:allophanate hydrolase [Brevibacillus reuszeri]|uniref:Allophanate hydrolase n=1 Tax=Brevibacillus reuszeri TaxID=54915 RepID=A0A0K9YRN5_9BACL|nr:carboxyltransferase domain-containing protein [Brevibacillus reuszeri]KNB70840.1 allophanate hydrolase [Brevibacillus reuszeri]MED1857229.1 carboxyltransferase domain-containing protein [Brevibacillus reuszeri]GED66943.1 allophanate hydrolase [Brevibacillus reuszeri]
MSTMKTLYEYGGDEFIFVQLSEEMSLKSNFTGMTITRKLKERQIEGILDICPSNASYMIRFNPDIVDPAWLMDELKDIEQTTDPFDVTISSRLVDVPVLFEDPWTHEALMRFRDRHQDPEATDLQYSARINGYDSTEEFIAAITSAPFLVSMIGFVPGLPWCFQMVQREKQIEVPKYVRPRTFTPERAFGFGGAFSVIYPVQGAGGYQLYGIAPAPIYQKEQTLPDFKESMVFPQQGDIFRYRSINREEYDDIRKQVENGTFSYQKQEFTFTPKEVLADLDSFAENVMRRLYHD